MSDGPGSVPFLTINFILEGIAMIIPQTPIQGSRPLFETAKLIDTLLQDRHLVIIANKIDWNEPLPYIYQFF
jgi:hypothetical protein